MSGIPISLPGWTQAVAWIFVLLLAAGVGVGVYNAWLRNKNREVLAEIHAKASLTLMVLRSWQEEREEWERPEPGHIAPEPEPEYDNPTPQVSSSAPQGTYTYEHPRGDVETTTPHGRLITS